MNQEWIDDIYETMIGVRQEKYRVPGVENAFGAESHCARQYEHLLACRQRLWERLGQEDDEDLEEILMATESIQRELCRKMFEYGCRFGNGH